MSGSGDSTQPAGAAMAASGSTEPVSREVPVINKRGLHARASAKFVQMVERFNAEVWVTRNGETVGGTSIMGLMMLAAGIGTSVTISAVGPQAQEAVDALTELMATKFGEED